MGLTFPVVERFHSLQGEGAHVGRSAFFIRLASCSVGCSWCDTKNSWSADKYPEESIQQLANESIEAHIQGAEFVVITGGEPLHHNLDPLCKAIRIISKEKQKVQIPIHIETSGVDSLSGSPDWITLSPKSHAPPKKEMLAICQELKVVIQTKEDLVFAESMAEQAIKAQTQITQKTHLKIKNQQPMLFLQPAWNNPKGRQLTIEYVKHHSKWRLSMQTHKWLGVL